MKCRSRPRFLGKALFAVAAVALLSWVVMMLWNAVVPELFSGGRPVDYLHALGLLVLSRILFGGFRGHCGWHERRHWGHGGQWEKLEAMTPEERSKFIDGVRSGRAAGAEEKA
jgi:hypothetical protein